MTDLDLLGMALLCSPLLFLPLLLVLRAASRPLASQPLQTVGALLLTATVLQGGNSPRDTILRCQ